MQGQTIVQIAFLVVSITLMSGASPAQCSGRGYYASHHDGDYAAAPAYREYSVAYGGGYRYGHGYPYGHGHRRGHASYRRHWGR